MSQWYPHSCPDGTWQPRTKGGDAIKMYFESSAACMAYLRRSGLVLPPGVAIIKGMTTANAAKFLAAWNARDERNRVMLLPKGTDILPVETSPAGPEDTPPDDDRWEWVNTATMSDAGPVWTKGACRHKTPEPVDAYPTGELVAWLCVDCGGTFEPDRWPVPEGMWRRIPALFDQHDDRPEPDFVDTHTDMGLVGDELHDHWLVSGVVLLAKEIKGLAEIAWGELLEPAWYGIKEWFEITLLCWPVIVVLVYYAKITVGWW